MAAWQDVEQAEPEFAARVRRLFEAGSLVGADPPSQRRVGGGWRWRRSAC